MVVSPYAPTGNTSVPSPFAMPTNSFATGILPTGEHVNFWGMHGYSGCIGLPKHLSSADTLGRLETINQIRNGRHDYGSSAIPRPATPSKEDKERAQKDTDAKKKEEEQEGKAKKKEVIRQQMAGLPPPPPTPRAPAPTFTYDSSLECINCLGTCGYETKKVQAADKQPMCWKCVWYQYLYGAYRAWDEPTA